MTGLALFGLLRFEIERGGILDGNGRLRSGRRIDRGGRIRCGRGPRLEGGVVPTTCGACAGRDALAICCEFGCCAEAVSRSARKRRMSPWNKAAAPARIATTPTPASATLARCRFGAATSTTSAAGAVEAVGRGAGRVLRATVGSSSAGAVRAADVAVTLLGAMRVSISPAAPDVVTGVRGAGDRISVAASAFASAVRIDASAQPSATRNSAIDCGRSRSLSSKPRSMPARNVGE